MDNKDFEKLVAILLSSAVGGALIGILMSSEKKELSRRDKLAQKGDRYIQELTNVIREIRQFLDSKSAEAKADIKATRHDFGELSEDAKGKGKKLVERARKLLSYEL